MVSHKRWQDGQRFPGSGIGSSRGESSLGYQRRDLDQRMSNVDVDLERSKSMKQTKVNVGVLKNARQKLAKALSKLIILERLPINLATSPWLHNLLREAAKLGPGVKCPSPYEISEIYLNEEYVASRNTEYYFNLLDKMVKEVGEEYVVQIVTDNEAALKAAGLKYWEKVKCPKSA
ncbi:hypothetical protein P8452_42709 [Trifolium repens]|nr:hypothetical protein P8452_42709 [Trifolium repens]